MLSIMIHDEEIEIEQYFVTLFFDREEVESMIMQYYQHYYSEYVFRQVDEEGASFTTDFTFYKDTEKHDVINDLMYYHNLKPIRIKLIENENK